MGMQRQVTDHGMEEHEFWERVGRQSERYNKFEIQPENLLQKYSNRGTAFVTFHYSAFELQRMATAMITRLRRSKARKSFSLVSNRGIYYIPQKSQGYLPNME